jgi:hypothetical protein
LKGELKLDISKEYKDYAAFFGDYINNTYDLYGKI